MWSASQRQPDRRSSSFRWLGQQQSERAAGRLDALGGDAAMLLARTYRDAARYEDALSRYDELLREEPLDWRAQEGLLIAAAGTRDIVRLEQAWREVCACLGGDCHSGARALYERLTREVSATRTTNGSGVGRVARPIPSTASESSGCNRSDGPCPASAPVCPCLLPLPDSQVVYLGLKSIHDQSDPGGIRYSRRCRRDRQCRYPRQTHECDRVLNSNTARRRLLAQAVKPSSKRLLACIFIDVGWAAVPSDQALSFEPERAHGPYPSSANRSSTPVYRPRAQHYTKRSVNCFGFSLLIHLPG